MAPDRRVGSQHSPHPADQTPAAFLPDLAISLNNLSNQQSNTGNRAAALASITAATVTRDPAATIRELKEQSGKDIWLWGA